MLGDFNAWFVNGDNGLLSDFLIETVRWITEDAFKQHAREVKEQRLREEEERTNAEVERFRTYNLSLKFFYRWKRNAREKRLRELRRKGRDDMRAFYAARHEASKRAREEAAEARKKAALASTAEATKKRSRDFVDMVKGRRQARREAAESLVASGVLSGLSRERELARSIVDQDLRSSTASQSSMGMSMSSSVGLPRAEGSKTRALRRMYLGERERFRRSLPSMASEDQGVAETTQRTSNASSRWRLKAMGIVPLEDGTAVPESLAREMAASAPSRVTRSVSPWRRRRISATEAMESEARRLTAALPASTADAGALAGKLTDDAEPARGAASPTMKRKHWLEDHGDEAAEMDSSSSSDGGANKRVMSDARRVRMELQALRSELEEGTHWFRDQNERLASESEARGTPWYDQSI